jgi:hypothetical protein
MKKILFTALLFPSLAFAQAASSSAQQEATSQSVAQGSIQFSQTPEHTSQTIRNVSAPILGAYASSFSQMNCASTAQAGVAVAGFSIAGGASKDSPSCVLEVAAAELARQSTIDAKNAAALQTAAIGVRCQISEEVYNAMRDAGFTCNRKPKSMHSRTDDQPENYKVSGQ